MCIVEKKIKLTEKLIPTHDFFVCNRLICLYVKRNRGNKLEQDEYRGKFAALVYPWSRNAARERSVRSAEIRADAPAFPPVDNNKTQRRVGSRRLLLLLKCRLAVWICASSDVVLLHAGEASAMLEDTREKENERERICSGVCASQAPRCTWSSKPSAESSGASVHSALFAPSVPWRSSFYPHRREICFREAE